MTFANDINDSVQSYIECNGFNCGKSILRDKRYTSGLYPDAVGSAWQAINDNGVWYHYCPEHKLASKTETHVKVNDQLYYCIHCKTNRVRAQVLDHDYSHDDSIGQHHFYYCSICHAKSETQPLPKGIQSQIETVFSRADPNAMIALGRVLAFGERKYQYQDVPVGQENWRHITVRDHWDHAMEHMWKELREMKSGPQPNDEDAGTHMEHALCRIMFALAMKLQNES